MTPEETLEQVLQRISSHATAWRTAAKRIMDKPAGQRHEADRKLSDQLKALALQAEQIIAWANEQSATVMPPQALRDDTDGTLFGEHTTQVNNFTGSMGDGGFMIQAGDIQGGVHR